MESLLDLHLDTLPEPTVVPGGEEYNLKIVSAKQVQSKSSERQLISVVLEAIDHPDAKSVFENLCFPLEGDADKTIYMFKDQFRNFFNAFGIDLKKPGDPAEWKGLEGWAFLKVEERNGVDENKVSRYIVKS